MGGVGRAGDMQSDMHMVAAGLGCNSGIVETRWANSCPGCMDRLRKCYSHLVGDWFLAEKAAWVLSRYLTTESAYYCMLIDKWVWLSSGVCLLRLEMNVGSLLKSELEQKWRHGTLKAYLG